MTPTATEDRTPIKFGTAEEFQARQKYLPQIRCAKEMLDCIIGKYEFSSKEKLQCGLNGCNSWHWNGYVIRTKDGHETHCGKDCGKREFGVVFEQVEAAYKSNEDRKSRAEYLDQLGRDRDMLLSESLQVYQLVSEATNFVQSITNEVRKDPIFDRAFSICIRSGGRIQVEDEDSKRLRSAMGASTEKADLKTIGVLRSVFIVNTSPFVASELKSQVITPLQNLTSENLDSLSLKDLTARASMFGNLRLTLNKGYQLLADFEHFSDPNNLKTFGLLIEVIPKKARTDRVRRIIERIRTSSTLRTASPTD